jgi:hypothetical protein
MVQKITEKPIVFLQRMPSVPTQSNFVDRAQFLHNIEISGDDAAVLAIYSP